MAKDKLKKHSSDTGVPSAFAVLLVIMVILLLHVVSVCKVGGVFCEITGSGKV